MNYQPITVEQFCNNNRVQLHKFSDSEFYFVYDKVSCTVVCYNRLDNDITNFLFEVTKEGVKYLNSISRERVNQIYNQHQGSYETI